MALFEERFNLLLNEFQELQSGKADKAKQPWHRAPMPGMNDTHSNIIAKRYKQREQGTDKDGNRKRPRYSGELNSKIEAIRNGTSNLQVLSKPDLKYIFDNYNLNDIPKDKPKSLFDGVIAVWDEMKDCFVLKRQ